MAKSDAALEAAMRNRRPRAAIAADMESTVFGKIESESKASTLIPVGSIRPSPFQARTSTDEAHVEALMTSIGESGLAVPILVRKVSTVDTSEQQYEMVSGHNRVEAFRRLNRPEIPAIVREMSDAEAARILTVTNTIQKKLADWELFRHIGMLRKANAVRNVTDLAAVLNCSRPLVYAIEAFEFLPDDAKKILDRRPDLIGARLAYQLRDLSVLHPKIVSEAIALLDQDKIKQGGVVGWVERRARPTEAPYRKEVAIKGGGKTVKMVITDGEARVSGDLNFDRLHALIEANIASLIDPPAGE